MQRVTHETDVSRYVVRKYDTLSSISMAKMGTPDYTNLYAENYDLIGDNPNNLKEGMTLIIPGVKSNETYID